MWQKLKRHRYQLIENGTETTKRLRRLSPSNSTFYILSMVCVAIVAFFGGRNSVQERFENNLELNTIPRVFHYNKTFAERPSAESDQAWQNLFPSQGGFFKHPTIAPERSAFAVFHQLHCLNGIRKSYYTIYTAALSNHSLAPDDLPTMSSPLHIRHCLDLLRQSLTCKPDLTIEIKDEKAGGVTGFGTEHKCRDWDQLVRWTEKWQTFRQDARAGEEGRLMHPRGVGADLA